MNRFRVAFLIGVLPLLSAQAGEGAVKLTVPPPLRKDIAAMPQITAPTGDAARRINEAVKQFDRTVIKAVASCKGGDWSRSVDVPMRGPHFISYTITDSIYCGDSAYPNASTMAIVYDLNTGKPVDWTRLLPATLTGKITLTEQAGMKTVVLESSRLFELYKAGYRAGEPKSDDLTQCRQVLADIAADSQPDTIIWLDKKGLAVRIELPHVAAACVEPVVISVDTLRKEGAAPALLAAF